MSKGAHLGKFEVLAPGTVLRLGDDAYGVTVRLEISAARRYRQQVLASLLQRR